ncbi:toxin C-terminal domain-containing protein [Streptococcus sp. NLN76]|uniref:toxin C-terminal domain-containing protein n=1 Tax=Streptococcus sp. NLN76 TaxID=2822800 RepID=UPI0032B5DEF0
MTYGLLLWFEIILPNRVHEIILTPPDHASHKGGYWKGADTKEKLLSKDARKGTYDKDLKRIDD